MAATLLCVAGMHPAPLSATGNARRAGRAFLPRSRSLAPASRAPGCSGAKGNVAPACDVRSDRLPRVLRDAATFAVGAASAGSSRAPGTPVPPQRRAVPTMERFTAGLTYLLLG